MSRQLMLVECLLLCDAGTKNSVDQVKMLGIIVF